MKDESRTWSQRGNAEAHTARRPRIGRLDPEAGPCWPRLVPLPRSASASSVQGLEIRGILLAGIMSRCPTTSSITTLLGDTTAASGSGQLRHTDTLQIWTSETGAGHPNPV